MKISVQFEADSADDYDRIIAALSGPGRSLFHAKVAATEESFVTREMVDEIIKEDMALLEKTADAWQEDEPVVAPPEKPKRGRKPKMAPIVEEPEEEPVEVLKPAPVVVKAKEPEIVVSRQDLLDVFAEYVQRYGASFGYTDISKLLQQNLGDGVRKASDVPEDELPVAIGVIRTALTDNPFNRKRDYA